MTRNYTGELNSEILELDFSRMKEGDEGVLLIYFGNYFYESDEYRNHDRLRIYYSVGKNGIGLSLLNFFIKSKPFVDFWVMYFFTLIS